MKLILRFACATALAFEAASAAPPYEAFEGRVMGTRYSVKVADRPDAILLDELRILVRDELERIEQVFSLFRTDSELCRVNAAPAGEWVEVSLDLWAVSCRALELAEKTGGAFDPTVGPLVRLWRIGDLSGDWKPPTANAIAAARQSVGFRLVETRHQPPAIRKLAPGVELDLNALVEGWALDRLIEMLQSRGTHHALVELGGEFRGIGRRGDGRAWRVGVEDPWQPAACYATLTLADAALATSGDYRQRREHHGITYSHIIDPRTGAPIEHDLTAVSVVAADAFTADGWTTALLVLGSEDGRRLAEQEGLAASFVSRTAADSAASLTSAGANKFEIVRGIGSASRAPTRVEWRLLGRFGAILGPAAVIALALWWLRSRAPPIRFSLHDDSGLPSGGACGGCRSRRESTHKP